MKTFLMAGVAVILSAGATFAADMPMAATPEEAVAPEFDWSGFYAGVQVGFARSETHTTLVDDHNATGYVDFSEGDGFDAESDGIVGGGHIGFNWQAGAFVFGAEGALFGADLEDTFIHNPDLDEYTTSVDFIATVSGRIGFAFDRALIYAKGGYAGANVSLDYSDPDPFEASVEEWHHGFNVGGGIEYAVTDSIILGVEYTFISLGEEAFTIEDGPGDRVDFESDLEIQTITAKLSYKF